MFYLTRQEIENIKAKAKKHPEFIEQIEKKNADVTKRIYIQETAKATWSHYFLCPKHTLQLEYDHMNPYEYKCPVDGEIFTGEPYEGAWWRLTLEKNKVAAFEFAIAYAATEDRKYLDIVHTILLGYAKYYPGYEVHGDIPYNHPGKATSQVLDDATFGVYMAKAYDIVKDTFTLEEQRNIEDNLLLEIGSHAKSQLVDQIHNHEVANCSALGIIGILLGRDDFIQRAVNEKYGLKYQLDNAILEDGFWFEGTVGYHEYSLLWFMEYEKIARNTPYSLLKDSHYRDKLYQMLTFTRKLVKKDLTVPLLNDGNQSYETKYSIFEFAYYIIPDEKILYNLKVCTEVLPRISVDSFIYGKALSENGSRKFENYFSEKGSNLAIIHGSEDRHFLFKALPYGGEHDHYDRLAISFSAFGKDICADLGTAHGYGAPLHYAYFKNTATHNTVVVNGDNMPPIDCKVIKYEEKAFDDIYMEVEADWTSRFTMPDSIFIKAWCDESYAGAKMRRTLKWFDKYFIDIFEFHVPNDLKKEWTWHIDGEQITIHNDTAKIASLSAKNPQAIFHDILSHKPSGIIKNTYDCSECMLDIHSLADGKEFTYAKGPANPSTHDICFIIEKTNERKAVFVNVIEAYKGEAVIDKVEIAKENKEVRVKILEKSGTEKTFAKKLSI